MITCQFKQIRLAAAVTLAMGFCTPAAFAVTNFTLSDASPSHSQLVNFSYSQFLSGNSTFTFTLNMLAGSSKIDLSTLLGVNLGTQIQFFDITGTTPETIGYTIPTVALGTFATTPNLLNGDYMAKVTVPLTGVNVNLTLTAENVTAVPEASDWAMMLAGLGLLGLQLRKRSGRMPVIRA